MLSINEYLLSKKNNKTTIEYSEISDQLDDKFKEYLTDIYSDEKYIYITFENISWNKYDDGIAYIYNEKALLVWYSRLQFAKPEYINKYWWLLFDEKNRIDTYAQVGQRINSDLQRKLRTEEIKLR